MKNPYSYLLLSRIFFRSSKTVAKSFYLLIFYFMFATQVFAQQQINVSGTVLDQSGEAVIGASVTVVGQKVGTVSDLDGKFSLSVAPQGAISVSFLGYITQTVSIDNRTQITVTLVEDIEKLDEVVVIGYGTAKKKDLTGAVASIKSEDILIAPTSNVMEALQGRVSGMDIMKTSGQVGEDVEVLLRGSRSIYGNNAPLYVIDGVIGSYDQVNPSDIDRVDVLKDASSTAIYGSAGANGVILITTKKGKEGKASVNFDAYVGFSADPQFFKGMTGDEWTNYQREAYKFINGQYPADMSSIITDPSILDAYNQNKWIDWVDEASGRTAVNQKYNVSVSAGGAKTKVFASLAYDKQEGLLKNEDQNRYMIRLNLDQEVFSWAKTGFTSNLSYSIRNRGVKNTFTRGLSSLPFGDAYDKDGNINHEYATGQYSPLGDFIKNQFVNNERATYFNGNAYLELTPLTGFSFKTMLGAALSDSRLGQYWGDQCNANRPSYAGSPHAEVTNTNTYKYTWDNILTYNTTFNEDHNIGATLLSSWEQGEDERSLAASTGQFLDSWSFYRLLAGKPSRVESGYTKYQKMSYAMRINYSYKGKYLFNFSNRWDGVSWLADGHKWDSFAAGALAWRVSDESFMEGTRAWLDNLKLRVGYGVTGNDGGLKPYSSTTGAEAYSTAGITIDKQVVTFSQYSGYYANPNLGWEKSYTWNIGLDFSVIKNRIDASIEWYSTTTKDLLFARTLPVTSGNTGWGKPLGIFTNIAETSNRGIELNLNSRNIQTKDFSWNTNITFSWSKEKIESLPSGDITDSSSKNLLKGHPINSFYDYKYAGIWGTDTPNDVLTAYNVKPGYIKIVTVPQTDGSGVSDQGVHQYSTKDRQYLGHLNPDYVIGLNNAFRYKDFDLSVFVMARYGQTIKSSMLGWYTADSDYKKNQISGANYWTENNQNAYYPIPGSGSQQSVMNSLQYRDGSFIKVKNITVGYTLPKKISKAALMEKCRFYMTAYNPFLYVKDKELRGTDPETNGSDSFPLYKQFVFGVNLSF